MQLLIVRGTPWSGRWIAAQNRGLRDGGLNAGFVRVEVDKGVKLWLARLDALEMGVDDLTGENALERMPSMISWIVEKAEVCMVRCVRVCGELGKVKRGKESTARDS